MAMDAAALGTAINAAINGMTDDDKKVPLKCWQALAGAIVAHIAANATITVSAGGLQRDNTGGNPATLAPAAPVVLTGVIS